MASLAETEAFKNVLKQARTHPEPAVELKRVLANIGSLAPQLPTATALITVADDVLTDPIGVVATRSVLDDLIAALRRSENHDTWIEVGQHIIRAIASGTSLASSLVEQAATLRELVATAHEANEDFLEAAKVLAEIPLDSSQRRVPDAEKAAVWIRIVRNHLEVDDSTTAETYLNKLKNVMHTVEDPELNLHFRLSAARIQDSNRQFLQAAKSYHDISFSPAIAEEERLHTLAMAIKCAILAPAGPLRSRALGQLYKDERSAGLEEFGILENMFFDRLLSAAEVDKFAQGLAPHQLAKTSDGSTVLAKAVVEHNLLSASRLYLDIGFDELGLLLGLDGDKAEDTTAKMIEQGRLSGSIDQIDRIIWFGGGEASGEKGSGRAEVLVGKEMRRWDSNVQALAEDVERITDALQAEFPDFVAAHIAV
ncbi:COP9 signalosome complex subunit 4 [Madurella mycetomatis]|uniref:COP9 signalosome complex subunit 4 n=1 Tax=Madurella mycetomatis TaxID=100816 RepID=A0A175VXP5_9PEZI|nr:COP9 signalosome complex subunit 4 [Madurella mycetomatis]